MSAPLVVIIVRWTVIAAASGLTSSASAQPVCATTTDRFAPIRELHYVVNARVRPLLFWIGRDKVGAGRIAWSRAGQSERIELLVGSDPSQTPLAVNRWGYLSETICDAGADLLGVMTESDERTPDQASANSLRVKSRRQAFRSIRSRISAGRSEADVARLTLDHPLTYRELDSLLPAVLQATGEKQGIAVAEDIQPGFLQAVVALAARAAPAERLERGQRALTYVYNGQLFDLQLSEAKRHATDIETEFRTRNRATGNVTKFSVSFDSVADAVTPTRIRFRPRWWFEAELVLDRQATLSAAADLARKTPR